MGYNGILLYWSAYQKTQALDFILCDTHRPVLDTTGCSEPSSHLNKPNKESPSQALDNAQAPADFKVGTVILMISQMVWKGNFLKGHWFLSLHL